MGYKVAKTRNVSDVVVNREDVFRLYRFFQDQFDSVSGRRSDVDSNGPSLVAINSKISITFVQQPDTHISFDGGVDLDENVIDLAKTERIAFSFMHYDHVERDISRSIDLVITEGDRVTYGDNLLRVSGSSKEWVDATFQATHEILASLQPQTKISPLLFYSIHLPLALWLGHFFKVIVGVFTPPPLPVDQLPEWAIYIRSSEWIFFFVSSLVSYGLGFFPAHSLLNWFRSQWPKVEFDFGPVHLRARKGFRSKMLFGGSIIIVPLVFEVFKRYVLGWS